MMRMAWTQSRVKTATAVILMVLNSVSFPLMALALKETTDAAIAHEIGRATVWGVGVALVTIAALTLGHFAHVAYFELSELNILEFDCELIALANGSARLEHLERPEYADKMSVLKQELQRLEWGMYGLLSISSLTVTVAITAVLLAGVEPLLLLLPIAAIPPLVASQRAQRLLDEERSASAPAIREGSHLYQLATRAKSAKELLTFRLRNETLRRYRALWQDVSDRLWKAEMRGLVGIVTGHLIFSAAYLAAVLLAVRQVVVGQGSVGDVVLVITLAAQVNQQVTQGVTLLRELQRMSQSITRLRWLRDLVATQEPPPPDASLPSVIRDGITFRDVGFTYPGTDRAVISRVNVRLEAGSTVALVGENGAGKTTLVKLLCRFYDATEGAILVDSIDIARTPLEEWRARIAVGFQDFMRLELPAQRTVGVGDLRRLDDEPAVLAALHRAQATDVLDRLEDGLATHLGKSYAEGVELSGGQWQKLALGRAMMRESPLLLILDEPTSALDAEAEHRLFMWYAENARRIGKRTGAITVLVSHRFSTVRMADTILVVADGQVAEAGDHATLVSNGGLYAELYTMQAAAYE